MKSKITFKNKSLTLVGRDLKTNTLAFDFTVVDSDLKDVNLLKYKDKIKIINTFPSLDTEVCNLQVKYFNQKAINLSKDIIILPISKDLPFAQKRFCSDFKIDNIDVLSDYKTSSFGLSYGVLIKELNLLARSCIILDKNNSIRFIQITDDLADPLNYNDIFDKLSEVIKNPQVEIKSNDLFSKCVPCETNGAELSKEKIAQFLNSIKNWTLIENKKIDKEFKFKDFTEAKYFLDLVSIIAQEKNHHPIFRLNYNKLKVTLTTHALNGLSENDFLLAKMIDEILTYSNV